MKHIFSLYILFVFGFIVILSFSAIAQIPNRGFDQWSYDQFSTFNPNGWQTDNTEIFVPPITRSTQSHSDSFAVRGGIGSYRNFPLLPDLHTGFSINRRPLFFTGYFQYFPDQGDSLIVYIQMFHQKGVAGTGTLAILDSAKSYTQFQVPIKYLTNDIPDSCFIGFQVHWGTPPWARIGPYVTYYLLDDLDFSDTSVVSDSSTVPDSESQLPGSYGLRQNYPNPFNPTTNIEFQIAQTSFVSLTVVDLLGRTIRPLVSEVLTPGVYKRVFIGASLSSGVYFYRLQTGHFVDVKKMILQK